MPTDFYKGLLIAAGTCVLGGAITLEGLSLVKDTHRGNQAEEQIIKRNLELEEKIPENYQIEFDKVCDWARQHRDWFIQKDLGSNFFNKEMLEREIEYQGMEISIAGRGYSRIYHTLLWLKKLSELESRFTNEIKASSLKDAKGLKSLKDLHTLLINKEWEAQEEARRNLFRGLSSIKN